MPFPHHVVLGLDAPIGFGLDLVRCDKGWGEVAFGVCPAVTEGHPVFQFPRISWPDFDSR